MAEWTLHDAKNSFAAIVDAALTGDPQRITREGKPAVVVLSADEYTRLCGHRQVSPPTQDNATTQEDIPSFVDHLLAIPQGGPEDFGFERLPLKPRSVDF